MKKVIMLIMAMCSLTVLAQAQVIQLDNQPIQSVAQDTMDLNTAIIPMSVPKIGYIVSLKEEEDEYWDKEYSDYDEDEKLPKHVYAYIEKVNLIIESGKRFALADLKGNREGTSNGLLIYDGQTYVQLTATEAENIQFSSDVLRSLNPNAAESIYLELFKPTSRIGRKIKSEDLKITTEAHLVGAIENFSEKGFFAYREDKSRKIGAVCYYERQPTEIVTPCVIKLGVKVDVLPLNVPVPKKSEEDD